MVDYFTWMCKLVETSDEDIELLRILDSYIYKWYLLLDENRAKGGLNLRNRYSNETGIFVNDLRDTGCSFLEMLIALSELMSDQIDNCEMSVCFWWLIDNLGLRYLANEWSIRNRIERFLANDYTSRFGGLFPIQNYNGDIRGLDLYSQMNAWLEENFPHQNIF